MAWTLPSPGRLGVLSTHGYHNCCRSGCLQRALGIGAGAL